MPSIDVYSFVSWKGRLLPAKQLVGLVEPAPGVDGYGLSVGAWRADPVDIITTAYVNAVSEAESLRESFRALQTADVAVMDQFGVTWPEVTIMSAVTEYSLSLIHGVRVETTWRLLVVSNPPAGAIS